MKKIFKLFLFFLFIFFISCTYEKGNITDEMTSDLISFNYEEIDYNHEENGKIISAGSIIKHKKDSILTIDYYAEEVGCPVFEGGFIMIGDTLTLYYQDINFRLVKYIGLFKLSYTIDIKNLDYKNIEVIRLKAVKKGFSFK
ncbi:hypothetical protein U8527_08350 [Kordia algicida OT-1]|uniref:Lipoprotein n=1 Tax=Kordia algicida OT-1 TaxID=391587 RepID=A9E6F4_9FLAO|nr:hypothetical protein [Kordia algicida]EDP95025.1 hypothetical protein KAOT1_01779 [Kordia algicida OT-1]